MSNSCANRLVLTGPAADLDDFEARAGVAAPVFHMPEPAPLFFSAFAPEPLGVAFPPTATRTPSAWHLAHWGVRHELDECTVRTRTRNRLRYEFDTAWTPPRPWITILAREYPTLAFTLHYLEPGNGIIGTTFCADGDTVETHMLDDEMAIAAHATTHFGWGLEAFDQDADDRDTPRLDPAAVEAARVMIVQDVLPHQSVRPADYAALASATTPESVHKRVAVWSAKRHLAPRTQTLLIARHAAVLDAPLVRRCLADPVAARLLGDSRALTPDLLPLVTTYVADRITTSPSPSLERAAATEPSPPDDSWFRRLVAAMDEGAQRMSSIRTATDDRVEHRLQSVRLGVRLRESGRWPLADAALQRLVRALPTLTPDQADACEAVVAVVMAGTDVPADVTHAAVAAAIRTQSAGALAALVLAPSIPADAYEAALQAGAVPDAVQHAIRTRGAPPRAHREALLRSYADHHSTIHALLPHLTPEEFPRAVTALVPNPSLLLRGLRAATPAQLHATSAHLLQPLLVHPDPKMREEAYGFIMRLKRNPAAPAPRSPRR